jgi:acyl carrier protein
MMTDQEILEKIREIFSRNFNLKPDQVVETSRLYEELGLDSLDAVDLVIELQEFTGKRIKPDVFKGVRTVADVIRVVRDIQAEGAA